MDLVQLKVLSLKLSLVAVAVGSIIKQPVIKLATRLDVGDNFPLV